MTISIVRVLKNSAQEPYGKSKDKREIKGSIYISQVIVLVNSQV